MRARKFLWAVFPKPKDFCRGPCGRHIRLAGLFIYRLAAKPLSQLVSLQEGAVIQPHDSIALRLPGGVQAKQGFPLTADGEGGDLLRAYAGLGQQRLNQFAKNAPILLRGKFHNVFAGRQKRIIPLLNANQTLIFVKERRLKSRRSSVYPQ